MKIIKLKTNHLTNPLGYGYPKPTFSWVVVETPSKMPQSVRVEVAKDEDFKSVVFDSEQCGDISSIAYTPDFPVEYATRYFWRVTVTGDTGDNACETAWFETPIAKLDAKWITPDLDAAIHPYLRKSFTLSGKIKSARAYVSGMGLYHLEINGKKAGDEYLSPSYNAYDKWIQFQTYDVTCCLKEGENAVGAMLGNGWAKGRFGFEGNVGSIYTDHFGFIMKLVVRYEDGTEAIIETDTGWKSFESPTERSEIYDGEIYNAAKTVKGWSEPGFDDSAWSGVKIHDPKLGELTARLSPPIKVMHEFKPKEIFKTPKGDTIIDAGQEVSGWLRLKINAPKDTKISLYHSEIMQHDEFYNDNLRSAKAEFHYISNGEPEVVEPKFTFFGFRYIKLEGWPGEVDPDDITVCAIYSELDAAGNIETSNPLVNKLFQNALWSQRDNFVDVPTDCPQRDERMGWTGDAQVFSGTASFNMDTAAFFHKYMTDIYAEQSKNNGGVPHVVPMVIRPGGNLGVFGGSACAWADAAAVIPWVTYMHYGDKGLLSAQYPSMKAWSDWIINRGVEVFTAGGWLSDFHFGDWLALDGPEEGGVMGGTEIAFLAAAYAVYSTYLTSTAADELGYKDDAKKYKEYSEKIKADMRKEYFTETGRGALQTQTFYFIALFMDIAPVEYRQRTFDALVKVLEKDKMHLKSGFIGTCISCRVLSDNGRSDLAYRLLLNEDIPSWLFPVKMGATTIWERWDSVGPDGLITSTGMNSLNHYAYGAIVEWMYRNMCGLQPLSPGFTKINIKPEPNKYFEFAKAEYESAAGLYKTGWEITKDGKLIFAVTVPFGATAELTLPDAELSKIDGSQGLAAKQDGSTVKIELTSGCYKFTYMPEKSYKRVFLNFDSPVEEIFESPKGRAVLERFNLVVDGPTAELLKKSSINQLKSHPFAGRHLAAIDLDAFEKALIEAND